MEAKEMFNFLEEADQATQALTFELPKMRKRLFIAMTYLRLEEDLAQMLKTIQTVEKPLREPKAALRWEDKAESSRQATSTDKISSQCREWAL